MREFNPEKLNPIPTMYFVKPAQAGCASLICPRKRRHSPQLHRSSKFELNNDRAVVPDSTPGRMYNPTWGRYHSLYL